jgi:hypothetical protein
MSLKVGNNYNDTENTNEAERQEEITSTEQLIFERQEN